MDQYNVISITPNLSELEKDMENWSMLTYDEKKAANDICMQRYNLSNENLYNFIKSKIINKQNSEEYINDNDSDYEKIIKTNSRNNNISLSEGSMVNVLEQWRYNSTVLPMLEAEITIEDDVLPPEGYTKSGRVNLNFEKIQKSIESVKDDNGDIVIINDFLDDYHMDYTMDDLNRFFDKYNNLSYDHKMESDMISTSIWGKDVPSMYNYMKGKISSMIDPIEKSMDIEISPVDKELNNFKYELLKAQRDHDIVENLRKQAQVKYNRKRSLYESAVLEGFFDKITVNGKSYQQGMPEVTPFLTYDEYVNNPRCLDEKKINFVDPFTYVMNFKDKEHKIKEELEEAYRNNDSGTLLSLGWNPVVEPTNENLKYAKQRQINWMNEYCGIDIFDLSKYSTELDQQELINNISEATNNGTMDLAPMYLVVSNGMLDVRRNKSMFGYSFYNDDWLNPGIAFEPKLDDIYYFSSTDDVALNNLEKDNLKRYVQYNRGADIAVIVFFVPRAIKKRVKDSVEKYYIQQTGSVHAFNNYTKLVFDTPKIASTNIDFACGQFLNSIFLISDLNLNQIYTNTIEKVTTVTSNKKAHMIMLYKGKAINYSPIKITNNTNALLAFNNYLDLTFFKKGLNLEKKTNNLRIKLLEDVYTITDNEEVNNILREMREIFKAKNFMESANITKSLDDYKNYVDSINVSLSECGYTDINKIQHLINELYNIKNELKSKDAVDSKELIESINSICIKYLSISEGGKI